MGWLWGDSTPSQPSAPDPAASRNEGATAPPTATQDGQAPPPLQPSRPLTRDELAEAELRAFLEELNYAPSDYAPESIPGPSAEAAPKAAPKTDPKTELKATPKTELKTALQAAKPATTDASAAAASPISPVRLLPGEMSCRSAFDQAWHCQLPGGQFGNVYRHGGMRDCSELWSNFRFCMRTNRGFMDEAERARRVRRHYWEREAKYRVGPSSEDVWRVRQERVDRPFEGDFEEVRHLLRAEERARKVDTE